MVFYDLVQRVEGYRLQPNMQLIREAYEFADAAHVGQKRLSGEPLIEHCLAAAALLTDLKVDEVTLAAALLHDVLEHADVNRKDLEREFGSVVADLVDGVTVIKKVKTRIGGYQQVDNLRKLLLATAKDVRVVLIRLAEKLHNLQTIDSLSPEKQKVVVNKVFDIYAPLAERLGVQHFKWQLEDAAFKYQNPFEHSRIQEFLDQTREDREKYIQQVIKFLEPELEKGGITAEIYGRPKHFYSIYKKLQKKQREGQSPTLTSIFDLLALTVLVDTVDQCYRVLGVAHQVFQPLDEEFDDYIAHPKPNGYRAIHTTVVGPEGKIVEIQIKTREMHEYNEFGPASHIYYKEAGKREVLPMDRLSWLKSLVEWQEDVKGEAEFERALKIDVFGDRVFVFTPKGDVLDLPAGATPLDFAYKLHTELGDSCVGAKVDGRLVPLGCQLATNQTVEILTSKQKKKPSADWLNSVKTTEARAKIRKSLRAV